MLKSVLEIFDLLDSATIDGAKVAQFLNSRGLRDIKVKTIKEVKGSTDFINIKVEGNKGKTLGGDAQILSHSCSSVMTNNSPWATRAEFLSWSCTP